MIRWSGRRDSNSRPPAPHAGTLPGCATPRDVEVYQRAEPDAFSAASNSMTLLSCCLRLERFTPRASVRVGAEVEDSERAGLALRLSSKRLRAPLMVKPCS